MRKVLCGMFVSASMIALSQGAWANGFEGLYIGAKAGANDSSAFGQSKTSGFVGGEVGYNVAVSDGMIFGADAWGDNHTQSATARDIGVDAKLGNVVDTLMYYVKVGVAGTHPGTRVHYGLGLEYKADPNWGALLEWTGDTMSKDTTTYNNNNVVVGVTYHF